MYATPPAVHALPPKPIFDHFSHTHTSTPSTSTSPKLPVELGPAIPGFHYSFCIQLSISPGPRREDIIFATQNAHANWLHPTGCPPEHQLPRNLPFYRGVIRELEELCKEISERPDSCKAELTVSEPQNSLETRPTNPSFETQRPKRDIVIGIWLAASDSSQILKLRSMILSRCPVSLVQNLFLPRLLFMLTSMPENCLD
jgi:hypothetical protein